MAMTVGQVKKFAALAGVSGKGSPKVTSPQSNTGFVVIEHQGEPKRISLEHFAALLKPQLGL